MWRDVESLNVGPPTTDTIEKGILNSAGGVLWIDEAFLDSDYIKTVEIPAFESVLQRQPMIIVPVFDRIGPTRGQGTP